jgi:quercetin dioxygenase-like cupin family protein
VLRSLNLPENKFNGSLIRLDKIGFFMSNGCSYVHEHSDPGSGFLVMVGGEGCTRMFFPESKSEATLTAKGEFVHVKHGVKHRVFSKGTRLCLSIFSYSEEDIKVINKNSRK